MFRFYMRGGRRRAFAQNPLAPLLEEAAALFGQQNYFRKYAQRTLGYMAHFGDWLQRTHISVERVTKEDGRRFIAQVTRLHRDRFRKGMVRTAVYRALSLIRKRYPATVAQSPAQVETNRYVEHLRTNRNLAEGSIAHHQQGLEEFLVAIFKRHPVDVKRITPAGIQAYVMSLPSTPHNGKRRRVCSALRGYFRFLQMRGVATQILAAAVPIVHVQRTALSPNMPASSEVNQLLRTIDRSTAAGKRNYAAVLCMTDVGMRVGDVARLSLNDVDWRAGTVLVNNHKRGRPYRLPLPKRLGTALTDYLAKGRPTSLSRELFLRHTRPFGEPIAAHVLKTAVRRAWEQSGLQDRFSGTHVLRHSAATRMKRRGVSLKSIADVLGHSSLQTAVLYTQVDLPALRKVAQSWPEVRS